MGDRGARVRVLRVITRLNIGGPSIQALELTRRLDARGYESTLAHGVVSAEEGDMRAWAPDFSGHGGRIVQIPALRRAVAPHDDLRASLRVLALQRRLHPAILHTHMAKAGAVGRIAAFIYNRVQPRAHRVRVVHTYHGHVLEGYFGPFATKTFIAIER